MMRTRDELENLINGSSLFLVDRVKDPEFFVAEERRFIADLAELMSLVRNDFTTIGVEIVQTAKACIKAYKTEFGNFLNYYNTALKRTVLTTRAKQIMAENRGGLTIDDKTDQTIRRIIKYAKVKGEDINSTGFAKKISGVLDVPLEVVIDAISVNDGMVVKSGNAYTTNNEGEDSELFSFIAAKSDMVEEAVLNEDSARMMLLSIDSEFQVQQQRTKPILSQLLTARLLEAVQEIEIIEKVFRGVGFVDFEMYGQFKISGTVPTAREIAEKHGVMEASASRTLKTFINKLKRGIIE